MGSSRQCAPLFLALLLVGCATPTPPAPASPPVRDGPIPEDLLLDVAVAVFDASIEADVDADRNPVVRPEIRRAEGHYLAYALKNELESSGHWAAVRVVPQSGAFEASDVAVSARIEDSDGEVLDLAVRVRDASGVVWLEKRYQSVASLLDYAAEALEDPLRPIFAAVADDMRSHLQSLANERLARIRATAEMRFAQSMAPTAFADYVVRQGDGFALRRLPAQSDPLLLAARRIRSREHMFLDALDGHFLNFADAVRRPYGHWRQATFRAKRTHRRLTQESRARALAGSVAVLEGIAATLEQQTPDAHLPPEALPPPEPNQKLTAGAWLLRGAEQDQAAADSYAEILYELGVSLEAEIMPHTLKLENRTVRLQGTLDEQYATLRALLREMWAQETGAPP